MAAAADVKDEDSQAMTTRVSSWQTATSDHENAFGCIDVAIVYC